MKYVELVMNHPLFLLFGGRFALPGKEPGFRVDKRYWEAAPKCDGGCKKVSRGIDEAVIRSTELGEV